ncbi:hypothetical protein BD779DRAFT_1498196 [Infundibulicybe gibba]|nr:hypothetical protein BD779DRAFT_1498196 [Infundibulicybe gibba]
MMKYFLWMLLWLSCAFAALQNKTILYDDATGVISRTGEWKKTIDVDPFPVCRSTFSSTPGATFSLKFKGTAVYFIAELDSMGGLYQAYIDGQADGSPIDNYINNIICGVTLYSKEGLSDADHTLTLALVGPSGPSASEIPPRIAVTRFLVTTTV